MRAAFDTLSALGATPAARIVARRLRERGVRAVVSRKAATNGASNGASNGDDHGLTGRELEVLGLVADGLRNDDIAGRLFISSKTVDHHVSAILRKLDVRTRAQAGAEAARRGLISSR